MSRNVLVRNIFIVAILVAVAAIAGRVVRFGNSLETKVQETNEKKDVITASVAAAANPEVLVKFRASTNENLIRQILKKRHDRIEDKIESVGGLYSIDDLDGKTAREVAEEYKGLTDYVEYAEPIMNLSFDDPKDTQDAHTHNLFLKQSDAKRYSAQKLREPSDTDEDSANSDVSVEVNEAGATTVRKTEQKPKLVHGPNDPLFEEQWALSNTGQEGGKAAADVNAMKAWLKTQGSNDVVVAVLDSGVNYDHQDLTSNIWTRPEGVSQYSDAELGTFDDKHGFSGDEQSRDPMDDNGHGTHCAGIIGAVGDNGEGIAGVNWNVQIMPLKFLGGFGTGTTKDAIEAINYAIDRKRAGVNVRVINASWGSTEYSKALEDAIRAAGEEGILFVAAAGNDGRNTDNNPYYPSNYKLPNVISVAALDRSDSKASFSNFGEKSVHIAAPGKDIVSCWLGAGYKYASGTSMAAPQVAGIAALIIAENPEITVEALVERIMRSAVPVDSLKGKVISGGRIDAEKALAAN